MKALKFFLLFALAVILHGCAQDDFETYTTDAEKNALYKAKAKEFAEKYDIQLSVNEENILDLIRTHTIDEMEKEIEMLSKIQFSSESKDGSKKSKLKIRKKVSLSENKEQEDGNFEFSYKSYNNTSDPRMVVIEQGTVEWHYRYKGLSYLDMEFEHRNQHFNLHIAPINFHKNNGLYFDHQGTYRLHCSYFSVDKGVFISFNQENNYHFVSISNL